MIGRKERELNKEIERLSHVDFISVPDESGEDFSVAVEILNIPRMDADGNAASSTAKDYTDFANKKIAELQQLNVTEDNQKNANIQKAIKKITEARDFLVENKLPEARQDAIKAYEGHKRILDMDTKIFHVLNHPAEHHASELDLHGLLNLDKNTPPEEVEATFQQFQQYLQDSSADLEKYPNRKNAPYYRDALPRTMEYLNQAHTNFQEVQKQSTRQGVSTAHSVSTQAQDNSLSAQFIRNSFNKTPYETLSLIDLPGGKDRMDRVDVLTSNRDVREVAMGYFTEIMNDKACTPEQRQQALNTLSHAVEVISKARELDKGTYGSSSQTIYEQYKDEIKNKFGKEPIESVSNAREKESQVENAPTNPQLGG